MLRLRGWLRGRLERRLGAPRIPLALERLAAAGFAPGAVLDVGAFHGEFAALCERLWPRSSIVCVEPLPEAAARLRALAAGRPGWTVVEAAAGAAPRWLPRTANPAPRCARSTTS